MEVKILLTAKRAWRGLATIPVVRPKAWKSAKIFFISICPAVLTYAKLDFSRGNGPKLIFQSWLGDYFQSSSQATIAFIFFPVVLPFFFDMVQERAESYKKSSPKGQDLAVVITALEKIVAFKLKRFGKFCKILKLNEKPCDHDQAFASITQPEKQIEKIIESLYHAAVEIYRDQDLKVVLVSVVNNVPTDYVCYMPEHKQPPFHLLNPGNKKSFFHHVNSENKACVIDDIEHALCKKGKKRCYVGDDGGGDGDSGSIVGVPIKHEYLEKNIYILTIKSDTPYKFTKANLSKVDKIVQFFGLRLNLEYSLSFIKEKLGPIKKEIIAV